MLSVLLGPDTGDRVDQVLIHLLALGAFCLKNADPTKPTNDLGLNAPFGARCFLTDNLLRSLNSGDSLNVPSGARCFLTAKTRITPWSVN